MQIKRETGYTDRDLFRVLIEIFYTGEEIEEKKMMEYLKIKKADVNRAEKIFVKHPKWLHMHESKIFPNYGTKDHIIFRWRRALKIKHLRHTNPSVLRRTVVLHFDENFQPINENELCIKLKSAKERDLQGMCDDLKIGAGKWKKVDLVSSIVRRGKQVFREEMEKVIGNDTPAKRILLDSQKMGKRKMRESLSENEPSLQKLSQTCKFQLLRDELKKVDTVQVFVIPIKKKLSAHSHLSLHRGLMEGKSLAEIEELECWRKKDMEDYVFAVLEAGFQVQEEQLCKFFNWRNEQVEQVKKCFDECVDWANLQVDTFVPPYLPRTCVRWYKIVLTNRFVCDEPLRVCEKLLLHFDSEANPTDFLTFQHKIKQLTKGSLKLIMKVNTLKFGAHKDKATLVNTLLLHLFSFYFLHKLPTIRQLFDNFKNHNFPPLLHNLKKAIPHLESILLSNEEEKQVAERLASQYLLHLQQERPSFNFTNLSNVPLAPSSSSQPFPPSSSPPHQLPSSPKVNSLFRSNTVSSFPLHPSSPISHQNNQNQNDISPEKESVKNQKKIKKDRKDGKDEKNGKNLRIKERKKDEIKDEEKEDVKINDKKSEEKKQDKREEMREDLRKLREKIAIENKVTQLDDIFTDETIEKLVSSPQKLNALIYGAISFAYELEFASIFDKYRPFLQNESSNHNYNQNPQESTLPSVTNLQKNNETIQNAPKNEGNQKTPFPPSTNLTLLAPKNNGQSLEQLEETIKQQRNQIEQLKQEIQKLKIQNEQTLRNNPFSSFSSPSSAEEQQEGFTNFKMGDLKLICYLRDLKQSGSKLEVIERIGTPFGQQTVPVLREFVKIAKFFRGNKIPSFLQTLQTNYSQENQPNHTSNPSNANDSNEPTSLQQKSNPEEEEEESEEIKENVTKGIRKRASATTCPKKDENLRNNKKLKLPTNEPTHPQIQQLVKQPQQQQPTHIQQANETKFPAVRSEQKIVLDLSDC